MLGVQNVFLRLVADVGKIDDFLAEMIKTCTLMFNI
jgi:hypothetical protein